GVHEHAARRGAAGRRRRVRDRHSLRAPRPLRSGGVRRRRARYRRARDRAARQRPELPRARHVRARDRGGRQMTPTSDARGAACGCCAGLEITTPAAIENRAGLSAVAYRIGTQPQWKASLLARLSSSEHPALAKLLTRDDDDFTIALLDAW